MERKNNIDSRFNVLGVSVSAIELEDVTGKVISAAQQHHPLSVAVLAVHGIMLAQSDPSLLTRVNSLNIVVPDGQPVRWALNLLHRAGQKERVYGPDLMLEICKNARALGLSVFLFGSTGKTLECLKRNLQARITGLEVAGMQASRFRQATKDEQEDDIRRIRRCGASIVFAGLGCPRQEIWAYENTEALSIPVLGVGAAFNYHAGMLKEPPRWIMRIGMQWLYRLSQEPLRLWKRYLLLNPAYLYLLCIQFLGFGRYPHRPENVAVRSLRPG